MKSKGFKYILSGSGIVILLIIVLLYSIFLGVNVGRGAEPVTIYIPSGSSYKQVRDTLNSHVSVRNWKVLNWIAEKKGYTDKIRPGKYIIYHDLSYIGLINMLRSGHQVPVSVTFINFRSINQLAGKVGGSIEADSAGIVAFLSNPENYSKDGFTRENIISVFIPNTYEFFWNTGPEGLYMRMLKENRKFWNKERLEKAKEKNLTPVEVSILASIIDDEVEKVDEKTRIAGVYLNRLKRGIPLQACPTIKFALNDFTITRILNKYLQVDSPYNTYKHKGFPPGPIRCASIEGLDAVLNAENHNYLYFVAKADFSGYHNFSRTLTEHNKYAAEYQKELDKRKIFR